MSAAQTNCPACGGPVRFKIGSALVVVCEYCRSAVARGDRKLEDLGKVSDITDTGAVLELGFKGRYHEVPFELVGRVQLGHEAGGVWDEWYAAFADGRWGWLAEAQGRYYLTFHLPADLKGLPAFEEIAVGGSVRLPPDKARYVITEKGVARPLAAEGEMPYLFQPGATYPYVDLSGEGASFGTLDYSDTAPLAFTGREVTLAQLGVPKTQRVREREARQVEGVQLNCPQCAGPLELRAPDHTERVGCPNCGSLLDVKEGKLALLMALSVPKVEPKLPLGSVGKFPEGEFRVIGFMQRSTTSEGIDYFWEEYLLYEPLLGFRWLTCDNDHWNYVTPLPAGDVSMHAGKASYQDQAFRLFQQGEARVTYVVGEFYWKVAIDERGETRDFIAPPKLLSRETTVSGVEVKEVNWSLATYLPRQEVEQAFGVSELARPATVGPNQPFLYKPIYRYWLYFLCAAVVLGAFFTALDTRHKVHESVYTLKSEPGSQEMKTFFSDTFELKPQRNIAVTVHASDLANAGVFVEGELIHKETGEVQPFTAEVFHYQGIEDGESWQENERERTVYLSSQPGGTYSLRLQVEREKPEQPVLLRVRVEQGVVRFISWLVMVGALTFIPLLVGVWHLFFEFLRWQESNCKDASA